MIQRVCGGRSAIGQNKHVVPAGATKVLQFDSTGSAVLSGDPAMTSALSVTPTSTLLTQDIFWIGNLFFHDPRPIPVEEGSTLYVHCGNAGSYFICFGSDEDS